MRAILVLTLGGAFLLGCQSPKPSDPAAAKGEASMSQPGDKAARGASAPRATSSTAPRATPIIESSGAVASVNTGLRFVVIDFHLNPLPKVDQRMSVYREGMKVGEVKISSQARNNIIAADLLAGEARVGDMVRAD
jgi:hypothetical protein